MRFELLCIEALALRAVTPCSLIHKYRRFARTLVSTRHHDTDDQYQHNVQPTTKLHASLGLNEFLDVAFDCLATNSGYADSNLYLKNNDVFRGFVQFIWTNLVIKDMLAHAVLRLREQESRVRDSVTVRGITVNRNTVISYMLLLEF